MKHKKTARFLSVVMSAALCLYSMDMNMNKVLADSISELEAQIEANESAIAEKRRRMSELENESLSAREYMETLSEKMALQQQNIDILNNRIAELDAGIEQRRYEISLLESDIAVKKEEIDKNIAAFRERLRSMYISGSDSMAEILTGATDFYDLLARSELINRVAEYDDDLINNLNNQLDEYNRQNDELHNQKKELEIQQKNAEEKRDVLQGEMNALIDEYESSQITLESLRADARLTESDIEWLNNRNYELEGQIEYIKEQERIAAEKARREAEERERRRQEELRRKEEEERRAREERQRYSDYSYDSSYDDYNTIDYSREVYTGDRSEIIDYAKTYLGIYYQWCGNYPASGHYGLDCSHFTFRVLEHFGLMDSYMDSRGQCRYCTPISASELQPGDLVFYYNSAGVVQHVTMYIGNGQIIGAQGGDSWVTSRASAESINAKVKIVSLDSDSRYKTFGRVPGME